MLKPIRIGIVVMGAVFALSGCTTTERSATVGGAAGAAIGGIASGSVGGAVVGGAIGAIAGGLIGESKRSGYCRYRNSRGQIYEARCSPKN
jgi:surface antigen